MTDKEAKEGVMKRYNLNEEQHQFAKDLCDCLTWDLFGSEYINCPETVKKLDELGYHKLKDIDNYKQAYHRIRNILNEYRQEADALVDENQELKKENKLRREHEAKVVKRYTNLKEEIFKKLYALLKFDGHSISIWKCDLMKLAKEYGVELEDE